MPDERATKLEQLMDVERPDILLASCDVKFAIDETKEGDILIEGWFITENLLKDRQMIVKTSAFMHPDGLTLFNGRVLAFHDQHKEPIGEVVDMKLVKGKGIKGSVRLYRENSELLKRAVRSGTLQGFSIGFAVDEWSYNEKTEIVTITKARFKELSLVNIGADMHSTFEVRNALRDADKTSATIVEFNVTEHEELSTLANEKKNENFDVSAFMSEQEQLGVRVDEVRNLYTAIKETQDQFATKMITKSEFLERLERMAGDLETMRQDIETARNEQTVKSERLAYTDYRAAITDFVWLTDDDGNKLGNIAQRAYCLFQMPVDYDNMEAGQELKNLRNLHDATLIADAMYRFRQRDRYSIQNLKLYKQLVKATEAFDKDVALAMAGGSTGYGAEWLPTELSSEFNEYLRKEPRLANRFQIWNMPKGGSAKFPFQNGRAVVYKGGEALVDNAEEARKTNIATGVKTFTPDLFIGALVASEELNEDTILDMVSFVRTELARALLEGLESAIINGDDSATHFDNAAGTTPYETWSVETCFKGIRKLAHSGAVDIETASSTTGVNSLELVNFTDAKGAMGVAGLNPRDCVYVTGIKGRSLVQNALFKANAYGVLAYMISGTLPTIDGSDIYISGQYAETLSSAGIQDSTADTKHTSMICVHKPSFRIGQRRGVTLEFNKNILTQQSQFVATARWDFGKICADAIVPYASMINMQHTA
jgi:HK97 family phage major capsid protein/HK97 family phage prohead protease